MTKKMARRLGGSDCCGQCDSWQSLQDDNAQGRCLRNPPTVTVLPGAAGRENEMRTEWPVTVPGDWCGEYV